jgi:AraC family transcriptional regulator of adaptative response/methylated-DNA-[protein]-cysteine methyltransferase
MTEGKTGDYERIERAIRFLDGHFREQPGLSEVARAAGLSGFHFQRLFTRWAGISPKRFVQFLTADYARELLRGSAGVLDAAWDAGLSGPGRLHDLVVHVHAATPGELKSLGTGLDIRYGIHPSPFGGCLVAATGRGVCALSFPAPHEVEETVAGIRNDWPRATVLEDPAATRAVARRIFSPPADGVPFALNVFVRGTNFQLKVWEALLRIPPGRAVPYEAVAAAAGFPAAVRAAANAVADNPVAFLIPCHRVIRKTGAFGNYRWGAVRKRAILAWEAARG